MLGVISLFSAFLLSLSALICYLPAISGKNAIAAGRRLYYAAAVCTIIASFSFLYAILQNKFQYLYVYNHSAMALNFWYKVSVFWAGQEGSFLLWFLLHVLVGCWLLHRRQIPESSFFIYILIQVIIAGFLFDKNPFVLKMTTADGIGLNPLLQNFWMVIHPPVVFIGYTAFAVPFSLTIGSLLNKNDNQNWLSAAANWSLFAWTTLGAGIFMGSYWAYRTLGWGGYWGWDPVENTSLIIWLAGAALSHILYIARNNKNLLRPAYLVSWLTFSLVLYSTFLTRSGVLGDFSVHAFGGGNNSYALMFGVFGIILFSGLILLRHWNDISKTNFSVLKYSRNFLLTYGIILFMSSVFLIFIGISTPLISTLIGQPQNISVNFYNNSLQLPVIAAIFGIAAAPWTPWNHKTCKRLWLFTILIVILLMTAVNCLHNLLQPSYLLISISAGIAVCSQLINAGSPLPFSVRLSHGSAALLLIGILFSSAGVITQNNITFSKQSPQVNVFGTSLHYIGSSDSENNTEFIHTLYFGKSKMELITLLDTEGSVAVNQPAVLHKWQGDYYLSDQGKSLSLSFKPLIALVWLGYIGITLGGYIRLYEKIHIKRFS